MIKVWCSGDELLHLLLIIYIKYDRVLQEYLFISTLFQSHYKHGRQNY